mgnify:CR=1 FL=1
MAERHLMANESAFQILADEMKATRTRVDSANGLLGDAKAYLIDLKALVEATRPVSVQNWPSPPTSVTFPSAQPVSGTVSIGNLPTPLPVSLPATTAPTNALVSLTTTGDLVAAQGAGVEIRLHAGVFGATTAVTVALRSNTTDLLPIRLAANQSVVLPWNDKGWCVTAANQALRIAFTGANTVTGFGQWRAA